MKTIDWEGKGNITKEIYQFVIEKIEYWKDEIEKSGKNDIKTGIVLALEQLKDFIEY
jgi:hypothetical protein